MSSKNGEIDVDEFVERIQKHQAFLYGQVFSIQVNPKVFEILGLSSDYNSGFMKIDGVTLTASPYIPFENIEVHFKSTAFGHVMGVTLKMADIYLCEILCEF